MAKGKMYIQHRSGSLLTTVLKCFILLSLPLRTTGQVGIVHRTVLQEIRRHGHLFRIMLRTFLLTSLVLCLVDSAVSTRRTVLQTIHYLNILNKVSSLIDEHGLGNYYERDTVTAFVPTSSAFAQFEVDARKYGYHLDIAVTMQEFLLFHIADGVMRTGQMTNDARLHTAHPDNRWLYLNVYPYGDSMVYSVNGAWIITADIEATNGVLHIIDKVIVPIQQIKPVAEFLLYPDISGLGFFSIAQASSIDPALRAATNDTRNKFTVFAPNDSYIMPMPNYGQDFLFQNLTLLREVFWAHVIEDEVLFVPRLGDIPDTPAKAGLVKFSRVGDEVYISNSRVQARIVTSNLAVANGVVHVIDDLLYYVYRNFMQKIQVLPGIQFVNSTIQKASQTFIDLLTDPDVRMTIFLPVDDAFAKLPIDKQMQLDNNVTRLTKMFRDHTVSYTLRELNSFQDRETFSTLDNKILTVHRYNGDVYIEGGGVRAKIITSDIGCTNGVIHLIGNVLFQRDFTIWEAIQGNSQLSKMKEFIVQHPRDIQDTLMSTTSGPMTVFLTSNAAISILPEQTVNHFNHYPEPLIQAVRSSIAKDVMLSSSQIPENLTVSATLGGQALVLRHSRRRISVVGSRITVTIVISDIWCSNGVLHMIDGILHVPTRSIADQINYTPSLSVISGVLRSFQSIRQDLGDLSNNFTMFVPSDDAFTFLPAERAKTMSRNSSLIAEILRGHIVADTTKFLEDYGKYTALKAATGLLYLIKTDDIVYAVNNNVRGNVVMGNVRCINGIIHIVDAMLFFPFHTIDETMQETPELRPFYSMLTYVEEFRNWAATPDIEQTIYIPTAQFLASLSDQHKKAISSDPRLVMQIFHGHFLPGTSLREPFLTSAFRESRIFPSESRYGTTFNFMDVSEGMTPATATVDVGYSNLRETVDLVKDGIGCSNGVIYLVHGFLNYPLYKLSDELSKPNISIATNQLKRLIPSGSSINFESTDRVYTVFAPADVALSFLSYEDINYINSDISLQERNQIVHRHVVEDVSLVYDDILNGGFNTYATGHNMTVISKTDGLYLKWETVEAKIIRQNILASNGMIHIVDKLLLSTPYQTTTTTTTTTTKSQTMSSASLVSSSVHIIFQLIVIIMSLCQR